MLINNFEVKNFDFKGIKRLVQKKNHLPKLKKFI